jgi:hypothetical protein
VLVLPDRDVNEGQDIQQEVRLVAVLEDTQDLLDHSLISENKLVKGCHKEGILDEEGVPVHHAKQEQVLVQKVAVETHVLNSEFIEIVGKQCH